MAGNAGRFAPFWRTFTACLTACTLKSVIRFCCKYLRNCNLLIACLTANLESIPFQLRAWNDLGLGDGRRSIRSVWTPGHKENKRETSVVACIIKKMMKCCTPTTAFRARGQLLKLFSYFQFILLFLRFIYGVASGSFICNCPHAAPSAARFHLNFFFFLFWCRNEINHAVWPASRKG